MRTLRGAEWEIMKAPAERNARVAENELAALLTAVRELFGEDAGGFVADLSLRELDHPAVRVDLNPERAFREVALRTLSQLINRGQQ